MVWLRDNNTHLNSSKSADDYRKAMFGEFVIDERQNALCDRLQEYYTITPDSMGNREAMKYWGLFKQWASERGYTQDEINKAKRARKYNF